MNVARAVALLAVPAKTRPGGQAERPGPMTNASQDQPVPQSDTGSAPAKRRHPAGGLPPEATPKVAPATRVGSARPAKQARFMPNMPPVPEDPPSRPTPGSSSSQAPPARAMAAMAARTADEPDVESNKGDKMSAPPSDDWWRKDRGGHARRDWYDWGNSGRYCNWRGEDQEWQQYGDQYQEPLQYHVQEAIDEPEMTDMQYDFKGDEAVTRAARMMAAKE